MRKQAGSVVPLLSSLMSTTSQTLPPPNPNPIPRKFPPPCWTDDESQALISIFKTRWTSLNRSNLKSHHWDDVAASLFPHLTPSKTAVQCHNKIHKLRKRFRSSSSSSFSRSSTWPLYPFLLDLETPPPPPHAHAHVTDRRRLDPVTSEVRQHERSGSGDEVAASIRELGEKYVEAERRKMEMEREVVMMQMEMELRQTRMVVESQRQMVDACLGALLNKTKKKRKVDVATME